MCYNLFIMLYIIANFSGFLTGLQNKAELERHGHQHHISYYISESV